MILCVFFRGFGFGFEANMANQSMQCLKRKTQAHLQTIRELSRAKEEKERNEMTVLCAVCCGGNVLCWRSWRWAVRKYFPGRGFHPSCFKLFASSVVSLETSVVTASSVRAVDRSAVETLASHARGIDAMLDAILTQVRTLCESVGCDAVGRSRGRD